MKAITLRNLSPELANVVRERARREGASIAETALRLMEEGAGLHKQALKRSLHHDLDSLAGSWTAKEADDFDRALAKQRSIDRELWK